MRFGRVTAGRMSAVWYRRLSLVLAFTLALQGLAIQAHIHLPHQLLGFSGAAGISASDGALADYAPCQLCQAFLSGGSYLTPAAVMLPAMLVVGLAAPLPLTARPDELARHAWQSRGPPHA